MARHHQFFGFLLAAAALAQAQGGRPFIDWLKEYSPTGHFIIMGWETGGNKPGDHKVHIQGQTTPLPAVAVHECGHMRNLAVNSKNGRKSYYIGGLKDYTLVPEFKPFLSSEILPDIPPALRNFITEVYIDAGSGSYSVGEGLLGLAEEWNQYITGLKSVTEMAACYRAHFNARRDWDALANDGTTSVWSNSEFRYFILRYVMLAKTKHPDVYAKITGGTATRQLYTHLVRFAEETLAEWMAVLKEQNMYTATGHGFDWYWKYWNEIQKPEYQEVEKLLLIPSVRIAPRGARPAVMAAGLPAGWYDARGRRLEVRGAGTNAVLLGGPEVAAAR